MPTDENNAVTPTVEANAFDISTLTPEIIESLPYVKELKEKHAAARTKMDESNLTKKQLEAEVARLKILAGEEAAVAEEVKPSFVTKEELSETLWESQNAKDLELYADEQFHKDVEIGVPRSKALEYAKLRQQKETNSAQLLRQQSMASSGSTSTRDLENIEITDKDREDMKKWGYSEATLLKHKKMKAARGQ